MLSALQICLDKDFHDLQQVASEQHAKARIEHEEPPLQPNSEAGSFDSSQSPPTPRDALRPCSYGERSAIFEVSGCELGQLNLLLLLCHRPGCEISDIARTFFRASPS